MRSDFAKIKNQSILKKLLKAAFFGNLVTLLFLAACAMLLWKGDIPESISKDLILGAAFAGSITAGIVASAGEGKGIIPGVLGGLSYLVVVAVIGLYREQGDFFDLSFIKLLICAVSGGIFGGVISTGKKNKKTNRRPKRYTKSNH